MSTEPAKPTLVEAVGTIVQALQSFTSEERRRVLSSALALIGESALTATALGTAVVPDSGLPQLPVPPPSGGKVADIRGLRDLKLPKSDNEMAAVVAHYLADLALPDERKGTIDTDDVKKYFKQAVHPLPKKPSQTLPNAKAAGYFDFVGDGKYKLNPVGHNLVVHTLPRTRPSTGVRRAKKSAVKKSRKAASPKAVPIAKARKRK